MPVTYRRITEKQAGTVIEFNGARESIIFAQIEKSDEPNAIIFVDSYIAPEDVNIGGKLDDLPCDIRAAMVFRRKQDILDFIDGLRSLYDMMK